MRRRIQFAEKGKYGRVAARIPADLERTCKRLASSEGWGLGDIYRSLIVLGACGSYLTLRPSERHEHTSDASFSSVTKQYLGGRLYAPRSGRRSRIITVYLPTGVARWLALYSKLTSELRSHVYARFLRAGLLIYVTSEQRLAEKLEASGSGASVDTNHDGR